MIESLSGTFSTARPSISALTRHRMSEDLTIVIPRMDHFGHLLTDWILPYFFAVKMAGLKAGDHVLAVDGTFTTPLLQQPLAQSQALMTYYQ